MLLDIAYLRVLHKSPLKPAIHPVKQDPFLLKHWSTSRQCPHVSSHLTPYEPLSHSKRIIIYTCIMYNFCNFCVKLARYGQSISVNISYT